ncbi:hypothetical protein AB1Y20_012947 [Prymnesium parvum]|uniref:Regulator of microtubule dynamics protein 1 n=1 Tax=Prymnesium parvum TaxID=97485 RepID=A0AB34IJU6_PRYPA
MACRLLPRALASARVFRHAYAASPAPPRLARAGAAAGALAAAFASAAAACEPRLAAADALFASNDYERLVDVLRAEARAAPDAEVLWRLARGLKKLADPLPAARQEPIVREALRHAEEALRRDGACGPAHKWYAILLSQVGGFGSTSEKIKNSFVVKEHFELAVKHSPEDATSRHLLGVWCFEVAKLSWIEKKAAAALFATPPSATLDEAIGHFLAAERMEPNFYPKNQLLLAQAYAKAGAKAEAKEWLAKCLSATPKTPEDEETLREAAKLKI